MEKELVFHIQKKEDRLIRKSLYSGDHAKCMEFWEKNSLNDEEYIFVREEDYADEFTEALYRLSNMKFEDGWRLTLDLPPYLEYLMCLAEKHGYIYSIEPSWSFFVKRSNRKGEKTTVFCVYQNLYDNPQAVEITTLSKMLAQVSEWANGNDGCAKEYGIGTRVKTISHLWNDLKN